MSKNDYQSKSEYNNMKYKRKIWYIYVKSLSRLFLSQSDSSSGHRVAVDVKKWKPQEVIYRNEVYKKNFRYLYH